MITLTNQDLTMDDFVNRQQMLLVHSLVHTKYLKPNIKLQLTNSNITLAKTHQ